MFFVSNLPSSSQAGRQSGCGLAGSGTINALVGGNAGLHITALADKAGVI